jgi:hypothetical protein
MSPTLDAARAAAALNVVLLLVLAGIWARTLREIRTKQTFGSLLFAALLLGENVLAVYYYNFADIDTLDVLSASQGSNTDHRFDALGLSGEAGLRDALGSNSRAAIILDYINNIATDSSRNSGYALGLKAEPW